MKSYLKLTIGYFQMNLSQKGYDSQSPTLYRIENASELVENARTRRKRVENASKTRRKRVEKV